MTRVAPTVPAENDLLCEGCGYTLNGLPADSNCPECGKPIEESIGSQRRVPTWEKAGGRTVTNFVRLSLLVLARPTRFYKTLATRRDIRPAQDFATLHWMACASFFAGAAFTHAMWYLRLTSWSIFDGRIEAATGFCGLAVAVYIMLAGTTRLAARLTNWEASYRGIRLPLNVVLRGMYYHAAHYTPVALLALMTVLGYQLLLKTGRLDLQSANAYLYVLCGEVIVFAAYLFHTYWIGMRNMMYANR